MTARRRPALDGFRLAAAVLVVMIHTSPLSGVAPPPDIRCAFTCLRYCSICH